MNDSMNCYQSVVHDTGSKKIQKKNIYCCTGYNRNNGIPFYGMRDYCYANTCCCNHIFRYVCCDGSFQTIHNQYCHKGTWQQISAFFKPERKPAIFEKQKWKSTIEKRNQCTEHIYNQCIITAHDLLPLHATIPALTANDGNRNLSPPSNNRKIIEIPKATYTGIWL